MSRLITKIALYTQLSVLILSVSLGALLFWRQEARIRLILCRPNCQNTHLAGSSLGESESNGISLSAMNLANMYLTDADLRGANLTGVSLAYTDLQGVKINDNTRLDAKWALIWKIVNQGVTGENLEGIDLSKNYLENAKLYGANLQQANLSDTYLKNAELHRAKLQQANLSNAYLEKANLCGANLQGADLRDANFSWADLREANLIETKVEGEWFVYTIYNDQTQWPSDSRPISAYYSSEKCSGRTARNRGW